MKLLSTVYLQTQHVQAIVNAAPDVEFVNDPRLLDVSMLRDRLLYSFPDVPEASTPKDRDPELDWGKMLTDAEILFGRLETSLPRPLPAAAPRLRWVQTINAGIGPAYESAGIAGSEIVVTTSSGAFSKLLAEFALAAALADRKNFRRLSELKAERSWHPFAARTLANAQVCVVGTGSIGEAVASAFAPLCAHIVGVNRTGVRKAGSPFAEVFGLSELPALVALSDYVVITLPATRDTTCLFDAELLRKCKRGCYLINVGRGRVIDELALAQALDDEILSGAALDVAAEEPLPEASRLWSLPTTLLSPHCTALVPGLGIDRVVEVFCANLARYRLGEPLLNVYVPERGY